MIITPKHLAIIMDGNGRWAKQRGLPRIAGHRTGAKVVHDIVEYCGQLKIEVLTLFAFSLENRGRPATEVNFLMNLFFDYLQRYTQQLHKNNVRLRIVGDRDLYNSRLVHKIQYAENLTRENKGLNLVMAINYSGRWDITQAIKKFTAEMLKKAEPDLSEITNDVVEKHLCLNDLPEPELLIRTSGEQRISNFMLWQLAYAEIYFTSVLWPDFSRLELMKALQFYQSRQRRFGLTPEQVAAQNA